MTRAVAVVGSGPAGLAAAWRLAESGRRVRIYEAGPGVGGRLRTETVAGRGADAVVQLLSSDYTRTVELLGAMGLSDRLVPAPGRDALWRGGRAHGLRYGSVSSMVASGALPVGLKMQLGLRYVPFLERHAGLLDLNDPVRAVGSGLDDISIAEWGREHIGEAFVESLAYPLLAAYYGVTPEETSAALFHALARAGMGVEVLGARGGMGTLAAAMGAALVDRGVEVRTESRVLALEPVGGGTGGGAGGGVDGGVRVVTTGALEAEEMVHEAVVLAVPAAVAAVLAPDLPLVAGIRTRAAAALVLATGSPVATGWFGLSVPRAEPPGETLAAVCVQGEKGTDVVGGAGGALVLVPAPAVAERWAEAEARAVVEEGVAALSRLLPSAAADVREARLVRLPAAVWVPEPGHFGRLASFDHASLPDWLALAGDYLVSPTVEGAVRSGLAAADRIAVTAGGA